MKTPKLRTALEWNSGVLKCVNCESSRHDRRSNCLCSRCSGFAKLIKEYKLRGDEITSAIEASPPDPGSMEEYMLRANGPSFYYDLVAEAQSQFEMRRHYESYARNESKPSGYDLEVLLSKVANMLNASDPFYGHASEFQDKIPESARALLYTYVLDMVDSKISARALVISRVRDKQKLR